MSINKQILRLAIPNIISNITIPILGLIDMTIVGHMGNASYIGAIALGGLLFNIIYWNFGFLRMGTSGLTAQAYGQKNWEEISHLLIRALTVALTIGFCFCLFQYPIKLLAFHLLKGSKEVETLSELYFSIRIWAAPAVLSIYVFNGWFIGMQNAKSPMYIAILINITNIIGNLLFVYGYEMKVEGVAWATVLAQYVGLFVTIGIWLHSYKRLLKYFNFKKSIEWVKLKRFFSINSFIFLRTLCLIIVTTFFTSTGAVQGDIILAINALLMELFMLYSYVMDGFAYAGEAITGKYFGARNTPLLQKTIAHLFYWGGGLSILFTLLYIFWGYDFLSFLTNETTVIEGVKEYYYWVLAIPITAFGAFMWDGIYIGATAAKQMFYAMFMASISFFIIYFSFSNQLHNHALWLAFIFYLSIRSITQTLWAKKIILR